MEIHVFGKHDCAKCTSTKNKIDHLITKWGASGEIKVNFFDMDSVDGLAEGAFRDVREVPTTIIEVDGRDMVRWDGAVPDTKELRAHFIGRA